jgi:hypothetical protein
MWTTTSHKNQQYPKVTTKGVAPKHARGMLPDCDAIAISIADTAPDITTGKTPPSTPRNFILESSFDLVSRSGRI